MTRPLVVGNWKMHGDGTWLDRVDAAAALANATPAVSVALCLPATLLHRAATRHPSLALGGQDCHAAPGGTHTGGISAAMLREAGARLVILGHSERRADGERDEAVAAKVAAADAAGLQIVLCVGETAAKHAAGQAAATVARQLVASLPPEPPASLVVAYEPVWAIGRGRLPGMDEIAPIVAAVGSALAGRSADATPILYGGSVDAAAVPGLMAHGILDGVLVGGASLDRAAFAGIVAVVACSVPSSVDMARPKRV